MLEKRIFFPLVQRLNSKEPEHRLRAVDTLSDAQDPRRIGPFTRRLFDASPQIRLRVTDDLRSAGLAPSVDAIEALYQHGASARKAALEALSPLFSLPMPAPHHAVIAVCSAGLHELFDEVAVLAAVHEDRFVRRAAVEGLYQCNQDALAPAFIFPAIDEDATVRRYAAVGLAENSMTAFAHRLRKDPDKVVREEATRAFSCPGQPWMVRDPYRKVMEKSEAFALPVIGSALLQADELPRLRSHARSMLQSEKAGQVAAALATLRCFGMSSRELEGSIFCLDSPLVRRFLHRDAVLSRSQDDKIPERIPELEGKRVLILGGDGRHKTMLERLRAAGLEIEWMSGFEQRAARSAINRLDAVVVIWKCISHAVAEHAPLIAERSGAPIIYARSATANAVLEAVLDVEDDLLVQ